jgi:hypothetical protein
VHLRKHDWLGERMTIIVGAATRHRAEQEAELA